MMRRAVQSSTSVHQAMIKTTSVGGEDGFIDLRVSAYADLSEAGGETHIRMDIKHATELHRKLGARIESAKRWEQRLEAAQRRNAQRRR